MFVQVKCYGVYGHILRDPLIVELDETEGIIDLLAHLENKIARVDSDAPLLMMQGKAVVKILLNGTEVNSNVRLHEGDLLMILPVMGGG